MADRRAQKNAEAMRLAQLITADGHRPRGLFGRRAQVVVELASEFSEPAAFVCVDSLLEALPRAVVRIPDRFGSLFAGDPRVVPADGRARELLRWPELRLVVNAPVRVLGLGLAALCAAMSRRGRRRRGRHLPGRRPRRSADHGRDRPPPRPGRSLGPRPRPGERKRPSRLGAAAPVGARCRGVPRRLGRMTAAASELAPIVARVWAETVAATHRPPLDDNVDPERFPGGMPVLTAAQSTERREHLAEHGADWQWLSDRLDAGSRQLLFERLVFYVLGHVHARIGPSPDQLRALLRTAHEQLITDRDVTPLRYAGSPNSHRFDLRPIGFPVTLESYMLGIQGTFQLQQYRCPTNATARPQRGDIAIDAGGCFGETALWLADAVGADGRVLTLEFDVENLVLLRGNLERNPSLASRITLLEAALWSRSGGSLQIDMGGPAATVSAGDVSAGHAGGGSVARSIALDDLVADGVIDRVDFVKLDIEGAEPMALAGAVGVLERFRPRLALATYHEIDHLWQLPRFLAGLQLGSASASATSRFTTRKRSCMAGYPPPVSSAGVRQQDTPQLSRERCGTDAAQDCDVSAGLAPCSGLAKGPVGRRPEKSHTGKTDHAEDRIREDAGRPPPAGRK